MIGSKLTHYEVVERLGAGGMGVVYRGKDLTLGRDVALKGACPSPCRFGQRQVAPGT